AMATAGVAAMAGISFTAKQAVTAYAEFEDRLADVMKTTGLTREGVGKLNEELKKINTRSSQEELLNLSRIAGKLGITDAKEILGFVKATDQIGVALKEDLGGNVEDAVRELGKLVDIFKLKEELGMESALLKIGSAINELGMASTANEKYLVEFAKRTAGIAPIAGVSVQNILGLAATLDSLGQTSEVSSTAYSQLMTTMSKKTGEFAKIAKMDLGEFSRLLKEDANEAMIRVFEGLRGNNTGMQELVAALGDIGLEGQRMTSVFGALANNTETLREQQKLANEAFDEGISLTNEFNVKNNTAQAELDKAKKKFAELRVELGEKLAPAYTSIVSKARLTLETFSALITIIDKYGRLIISLTAAIVAYTIATRFSTVAKRENFLQTKLGIALEKTYITVKALLTGQIGLATIAQRTWNTAVKANPIGAALAVIIAVAGAIWQYSKNTREATAARKALNDVEIVARQNIVEQKQKVNDLLAVAQSEKMSLDKRKRALELLNKISPEYFGNLSIEKLNAENAKAALDNYTESLLKNARVKAAEQKIIELEKQRIEAQLSGADKQVKWYQTTWNIISNLTDSEAFSRKQYATQTENATKAQQKFNDQIKALTEFIKNNQENPLSSVLEGNETPDSVDGIFGTPEQQSAAQEKLLKFLEETDEKMRSDIDRYFREAGEGAMEAFFESIDKKKNEYKNIFDKFPLKPEETDDVDVDYALEKFRETEQGKLNELNARLQAGKISEQQYQDEVTKIAKENEEKRLKEKQKKSEDAQKLANFAANFIYSLMDLELEKAGENEEKKKEIRKKYANIEFLVTAAQIVTDTASAIMKGFSELGPIGGAIAAAILGATGAVQLGIANAQRQKVQGYSEGGYTAPGDKNEPAGIVHKGEWVATKDMVRSPVTGPIISILESMRKKNIQINSQAIQNIPTRGYQTGGIVAPSGSLSDSAKEIKILPGMLGNITDQQQNEILSKLAIAVDDLMKWKPKVYTEDIKKGLDNLDNIDKNRGL
ncbi:MAG TPA: phage tail tape measure protein, partial [Prolixibacteraceae bacterium]|nr:phage tail tape measure protein [Prolixibacteraceae bacterium]